MKKYIVMLVGLCNMVYAAENEQQMSQSCPDFVAAFKNDDLRTYFKKHSQGLDKHPFKTYKGYPEHLVAVPEEYYPKYLVTVYERTMKKKELSVSQ